MSTSANAAIVAALLDFLDEYEDLVLSPNGKHMRYSDGRPIVLDVILARQALDRLREGK